MATVDEESANFYRISSLILDIGTSLLLRRLKNEIQPLTLDEFLNKSEIKSDLRKLKFLDRNQFSIVSSVPVCEDKFDISLIVKLLLNVCHNVVQPGTCWDNNPPDNDLSLVADLNRLRNIRNSSSMLAHGSRAKMSEVEFTDTWAKVKEILIRRSIEMGETGGVVEKEINDLMERKLDPSKLEDKCQEMIAMWKKWREDDERAYADINEQLSSMKSSIESLHDKVGTRQSSKELLELHHQLNILLQSQGREQITLDKDLPPEQMIKSLLEHIQSLNEMAGKQPATDEVDGGQRSETDSKGMKDKELDQIAQKIGNEWQQLGIYLGYKSVQLDRLTGLYRNQVQGRIFKMLQKWHSVVLQHNEDPQKFLASVFVEMKNLEVAQDIDEEATLDMRYEPRQSTLDAVQQINFDLR